MFVPNFGRLIRFSLMKTGKGLGRNESGITDAIRPKLKFDTQGVGHNASEQFTYHWWEQAFNNAASNIQVASSEVSLLINYGTCQVFEMKPADCRILN